MHHSPLLGRGLHTLPLVLLTACMALLWPAVRVAAQVAGGDAVSRAVERRRDGDGYADRARAAANGAANVCARVFREVLKQ